MLKMIGFIFVNNGIQNDIDSSPKRC